MLAALNPETQRFHRIKWRQIVQASDGMEGDIGETGGEVKLGGTSTKAFPAFLYKFQPEKWPRRRLCLLPVLRDERKV
jgi:hypothetical protein